MIQKGSFSEFTRKYALSKTLRFELVPQGETYDNLKLAGILSRDIEKDEAYHKVKPFFDLLHEKFIHESLSNLSIDWKNYKIQFNIIQKTQEREVKQKLIKELEKIEKTLRQEITKSFDTMGSSWEDMLNIQDEKNKEKKKLGIKILFTKPVLQLLKNENKENEDILKEISKFDNFFTYFTGFNQNRANYYSSEDNITAISYRIVNENLPKFCSNILSYEGRKIEYDEMKTFLQEKNISLTATDGHTLQDINSIQFTSEYFNKCLNQQQIEGYNEFIGDINFTINLYNQQKGNDKSFKKLSLFKTLFKQIGCGKKDALFFSVNSDEEMTKLLQTFLYTGSEKNTQIIDFIGELPKKDDFSQIYFSKKSLNTLSAKYFIGGWSLLSQLFLATKLGKYDKKTDEVKVAGDYITLAEIFEALETSIELTENIFKIGRKFENSDRGEWENLFSTSKKETFLAILLYEFQKTYKQWEILKRELETKIGNINYKNEGDKTIIKLFCDESLVLIQMLKYFTIRLSKVPNGVDTEFYNVLDTILNRDEYDVFKWYDATRNYLTQRPENKEKLKLNFDQATLLGGWDINKESANLGVILKDENGREYLAITNKKYNFSFDTEKNKKLYEVSNNMIWQKMEYNFWSDISKMIPKCSTQLKDVNKHFISSGENFILQGKVSSGEIFHQPCIISKRTFELNNRVFQKINILNSKIKTKGDKDTEWIKQFQKEYLTISGDTEGYKLALNDWINFCKHFVSVYPKTRQFQYNFKQTSEYNSLDEFYGDIDKYSYKLDFVPLNKTILDEMVQKGEVYLFLIKNKDIINKDTTKNKNIHTLYWKALFDSLENKPKLNGEAEVFFREKTKELLIKKDTKGKEVIDKKRYAKDTFLFHVPITLNFCAKDEKINDEVNKKIVADFDEMHIIGIDRGEKHLAYYSVIDIKGNIVEQGTLNIPFQNPIKKIKPDGIDVLIHDYNELLDFYAGNREDARKNWKTIGTIKELKEGYIGQVIHEIVKLIQKYNAVVVLEDLNTGFKRGRQKIEKSIYQKLELALARKLNFLVEKGKSGDEIGSSTNALQLTPPVQNYQDIEGKKQVGIMFYTRANYTSVTDPVTGWRKNIYLKNGSIDDIKEQIKNFTEIGYDFQKKAYYFVYDPKNFIGNKALPKQWTLWSSVDRYRGEKNTQGIWEIQKIDITKMIDTIFMECDKNRDIINQLIEEGIEPQKINDKHIGWGSLLYAINLIMQIRNTSITGEDYLQSPVIDEKSGVQYDSRTWLARNNGSELKNTLELPISGDANGAFNIARKGLMMISNIKKNSAKPELYISDIEWDRYIQI